MNHLTVCVKIMSVTKKQRRTASVRLQSFGLFLAPMFPEHVHGKLLECATWDRLSSLPSPKPGNARRRTDWAVCPTTVPYTL